MGKRFLTIFILVVSALLSATTTTHADTAGSSAALTPIEISKPKDNRSEILHDYLLKYNSPLAPYAKNFIDEADRNNLDWKLVVSIAGNESYFGQMIPSNSYNGWGYGIYGNNVRYFSSWDEGIAVVSKAIRTDYVNKLGTSNIYEIGSMYAQDPTWANKVTNYMASLDQFASENPNHVLSISL